MTSSTPSTRIPYCAEDLVGRRRERPTRSRSAALSSPSAVRYPRGTGPGVPIVADMTALPVGRAQTRREGRSGLAILVFGTLLESARKIAERLDATLVNMHFVKPLDATLVESVAERHRAIVTVEENAVMGGAGSAVAGGFDHIVGAAQVRLEQFKALGIIVGDENARGTGLGHINSSFVYGAMVKIAW